jgi:DNA-binding MarR family transcriptional regulator
VPTDTPETSPPGPPRGGGVAFLLAQLGAHATARFAKRVATLDLTPPQAGLLRAIAADPGSSQQQLAGRLGMLPSRVVAFVDELEERGLVRRERSSTDRRQYALQLTDAGKGMLRRIGVLAREHEHDVTQALSAADRGQLADLLRRIADQQELTPGVHTGFRHLGAPPQQKP